MSYNTIFATCLIMMIVARKIINRRSLSFFFSSASWRRINLKNSGGYDFANLYLQMNVYFHYAQFYYECSKQNASSGYLPPFRKWEYSNICSPENSTFMNVKMPEPYICRWTPVPRSHTLSILMLSIIIPVHHWLIILPRIYSLKNLNITIKKYWK